MLTSFMDGPQGGLRGRLLRGQDGADRGQGGQPGEEELEGQGQELDAGTQLNRRLILPPMI